MTRLLVCALVVAGAVFIETSTGAGHATLTCGDCHVSHTPGMAGSRSLWNTEQMADGLPTFALYNSSTFDALGTDIGQPDGASKLCLGCHDGTFGSLRDTSGNLAFGAADMGQSHPVSFTYDSTLAARVPSGRLNDPGVALSGLGNTIATDLLDEKGKMQCTSCHDPHASRAVGPSLLRYDYSPGTPGGERICKVCHKM